MSAGARHAVALVATLAIHLVAVAALVAPTRSDEVSDQIVAEFDMEEPPPEPEPVPEPEPAPEPETTPEPEKPEPEPEPERPEPRPAPPPEPAPPPPDEPGDPAPGWATEPPSSDQPYDLGDAVPVGQARAPAARGKGGTGGGSGRGGGGEPGGTGSGEPVPVSVSEIKTMPMPIGDTDFIEAHKDYPADARRLGIEGQVKVRLVVDAEGQVASRRLVTRLGHGLDQLAMRLAHKLRFHPAIDTGDRPVPAVVVWTFTFTLPK